MTHPTETVSAGSLTMLKMAPLKFQIFVFLKAISSKTVS
jgi:hypothetical protein